jgi:hypothetical protein
MRWIGGGSSSSGCGSAARVLRGEGGNCNSMGGRGHGAAYLWGDRGASACGPRRAVRRVPARLGFDSKPSSRRKMNAPTGGARLSTVERDGGGVG